MTERVSALSAALTRRNDLLAQLAAEDTDCVRLLHGVAEGAPGTTVDRFGPVLLVQTWRELLEEGELEAMASVVDAALGVSLLPVWNHRGETSHPGSPYDPATEGAIGKEFGLSYDVRPRHRGQDPYLFLDFRVARRWARAACAGKDVLNLYAYTCGIGVAAAAGLAPGQGAASVVNVDFSKSALFIGQENAKKNQIDGRFTTLLGDAQVIARQFAGLPHTGRRQQGVPLPTPRPKRAFDVVIVDPPRWAKSSFGAVDVVRDYPSLFKPALLSTKPGGVVMATNHVATVDREGWHAVLRRTAEKAERPLASIEVLMPEADFPSFDGAPPLKIAVCTLAS